MLTMDRPLQQSAPAQSAHNTLATVRNKLPVGTTANCQCAPGPGTRYYRRRAIDVIVIAMDVDLSGYGMQAARAALPQCQCPRRVPLATVRRTDPRPAAEGHRGPWAWRLELVGKHSGMRTLLAPI